jgi:type II secretory pathway pseudopilin PulG
MRKRNILKNNGGYTLVELLAFTSIIVIVSGLIVGILYSTLRGGNKTKATNDVSQNGNYALSVISNTALIARDVTKVGGVDVSDCTIKKQGTSIEFEQEDGSLVSYACDASSQSIASASGSTTGYLIDNTSTKVDPATCNFSCFQSTGNPYSAPIISVAFTISQKSSSALFENVASGQYKTSVTMRNYSPR